MIVAVANQKGGVGRTTTTLGIARALVEAGRRVVVVDADPQASATLALGVDPGAQASLADLLDDPAAGLDAAAIDTSWGFGLVPANEDLALRERSHRIGDEFLLRKALGDLEPERVVLLDCPPSLGVLTTTALIAAERVLLVTTATFLALSATGAFLDTLARVAEDYNPQVAIAGVVVNQWRHTNRHREHLAQLDDAFPGLVWRPLVPLRDAAEASTSTGLPLSALRQPGAAAVAGCYEVFADRLIAGQLARELDS